MTEPAKMPKMWREYSIRVPKELGDTLDTAMAKQREFEDREIENSEYFCWLLLLGLNEVVRMNEAAKKMDARIIAPGSNGMTMPGKGPICVHCNRSVFEPGTCHALHPARQQP